MSAAASLMRWHHDSSSQPHTPGYHDRGSHPHALATMTAAASLMHLPPVLCRAAVEGEYLGEVSKWRWPILCFVFCFDVFTFTLRLLAKLVSSGAFGGERLW